MKVLIADYGLNVWYGDIYDYEERLTMLKSIGYDGLERLHARTEAEVLYTSALANRLGMSFATCEGGTRAQSILWSSALGQKYVWVNNDARDFETFCRQANAQIKAARRQGITAALHNHLGSPVETQQQLIEYMNRCPESGLILDIGHLVGAGGDPLEIIDMFFERIVMVHLKDFVFMDTSSSNWWERLRFCELGTGELGNLTLDVLKKLSDMGYSNWLAVEHDTHLVDPVADLKNSREFIRRAGI